MSDLPECPYLPGEAWRLPGIVPASLYRNEIDPPRHVMATLAALARGCLPQDNPPADWVKAIDVDAMNAPMLSFALRFGLVDCWDGQSRRRDWLDTVRKRPDGSAEPVAHSAALQTLWSGYAGIMRAELIVRCETAAEAGPRIEREWAVWNVARATAFEAEWRNKAAWPPGLALAWHCFEGDWARIATYFKFGAIPSDGAFLCLFGATLWGGEASLRQRESAAALMTALRRGDASRIVARGRFNGGGRLEEIPPADLCALEWSLHQHNGDDGAVLTGRGIFWTNVVLDAASVVKAFSRGGAPEPRRDKVEFIRDAADKVVKPGMRADERDEAIRRHLGWRTGPGTTAIKDALRGTHHLRSRGKSD